MAEALNQETPTPAPTSQGWPSPTPGSYTIPDFTFSTGETIASLRLHYQTLGIPRTSRAASGHVTNAVLIMHGTGGSGSQFLVPQFAGLLFNRGQPLDAEKYFLILRDGIGHGGSSKPSDCPDDAQEFPRYRYADMVRADHRLLTEHLGVDHLRLVMGTSQGGMLSWLWGETYPDFMDALMPLASLPVQIAGRNRMWRKMAMDAIRADLAALAREDGVVGGQSRPSPGLTTALDILTLMSSSPLQYQHQCPTRDAADAFLDARLRAGLASTDPRDILYALDASWDYDPQPRLGRITAPLLAVNSADDQINPPELGILEREVNGGSGLVNCPWKRAVVLPISEATRGHGSHTWAVLWKGLLEELLVKSARPVRDGRDVDSGSRLLIELITST